MTKSKDPNIILYISFALDIFSTLSAIINRSITPIAYRVILLNLAYQHQQSPCVQEGLEFEDADDFVESCIDHFSPNSVVSSLLENDALNQKIKEYIQQYYKSNTESEDESVEAIDPIAQKQIRGTLKLTVKIEILVQELKSVKTDGINDIALETIKQQQVLFKKEIREIEASDLLQSDEDLLSKPIKVVRSAYENFLYRLSVANFEREFSGAYEFIEKFME